MNLSTTQGIQDPVSEIKMEPTQWCRHLPSSLCLISRTHMVEGENQVPQVAL